MRALHSRLKTEHDLLLAADDQTAVNDLVRARSLAEMQAEQQNFSSETDSVICGKILLLFLQRLHDITNTFTFYDNKKANDSLKCFNHFNEFLPYHKKIKADNLRLINCLF